MQTFDHVSASQIDTFGDCRRKWWFQSILGLRPPPSPAAALGSAVHAALEAYVLTGAMPDPRSPAGAIALAGLPFARSTGPEPLLVELDMAGHAANDLRLAGVAVHGRIDLIDPNADPLLVQDWKTTSSIRWAKSEDQLRTNAQAILYSRFMLAWSAHRGRPADSVRFQHIVLTTKGPVSAQKTAVDLHRDQIAEEFARLDPIVALMRDHATAPRPSEVPATKSSCAKYGGCPFRERCEAIGSWSRTLHEIDHTASHMTRQEESVSTNPAVAALKALQAKKAAIANGSSGASATPTHPIPPPASPDASDTPKNSTVGPSRPTPPNPGAGSAIVPPDAGTDDWSTEGKPAGWGGEARALFDERAGIREFEGKQPRGLAERAAEREVRAMVEQRAAAPPPSPPPPTPPPPPPVAPPAPAPAPVVASEAPPVYAETTAPPPSSGSSVLSSSAGGAASRALVLYIDCYPQRGVAGITHLEDVIAPLQARIAARAGVPIYSLIEYGKGPAQIAAALLEAPPTGPVYVNSRLPASAAALEVLLPMAVGVVRGH